MAAAPVFPLAQWAYSGTDDTVGVKLFPLSSGNSLPALVVWLILTTNPSLANALTSSDEDDQAARTTAIAEISGTVNLTPACVASILNQFVSGTKSGTSAEDVSAAFTTVTDSFHSLGGPGEYPPDECPYLGDILSLANAVKNFTPVPAPAAQASKQ
jgi:hypothetical protein